MRWPVLALTLLVSLVVLVVTACTVGPAGGTDALLATPAPTSGTRPTPPAANATPGAVATPAAEATPFVPPGGSPPIALPDPPGGLPAHGIGERVPIGDAVVTLTGVTERDGDQYATFEASAGALDGARLVVGDSVFTVHATDGGYEAGPIPPAVLAATPGRLMTLAVGEAIVPFSPTSGT